MKKLDIYIIRKFLGTFFFSILLIISIAIIFDFSEKIDDFLEEPVPSFSEIVFDYYLPFIPYFANLFSYLFTFIAVIFFTSKMASNSEIVAILSNGISFNRLMLPYFISAGIIALFTFVLSAYVIPPATKVKLDFEEHYIRSRFQNRDRHIHRQLGNGVYAYMESFNTTNNIGQKFSLETFDGNMLKSKLMSKRIQWDSLKNKWTVHDYSIRTINGLDEKIVKGKTIDTTLTMLPEDFSTRENVVETMTLPVLNKFIKKQKAIGVESIEFYQIEKYRRIASPFAVFILTLIGMSLSVYKTRGGLGAHIGVGIVLSFSYILFMQVAHQFAISGDMLPMLAVWLPNIFFLLIGIGLYKIAPK